MRTDYFTLDAFREYAHDQDSARYADEAIIRCQDDVIRRLEDWSASSWANVERTAIDDATYIVSEISGDTLTTFEAVFADSAVGDAVAIVYGDGVDVLGTLTTTIKTVTSATSIQVEGSVGVGNIGLTIAFDGDGRALSERSRVDTFDGGFSAYALRRLPVVAVASLTVGGTVTTDYFLYPESGVIRFASAVEDSWQAVEVDYTFGESPTPYAVKHPVMGAVKSLLDTMEGRGSIPEGVSQYTTEGTTFVFGESPLATQPFPWDKDASEAIKAFWRPYRPTAIGAI